MSLVTIKDNIDNYEENINDVYYLGNNYLNLGSINSNKNKNILLYTINNYTKVPFISFILKKNEKKLNIINLNKFEKLKPLELQIEIKKKFNFIDSINYKGYYMFNNEIFLFYEYKKLNNDDKNYNFNKLEYVDVIISEIINYNKCFDYTIDKKLVELFLNNKLFNFLKNNDIILESPEIYYKYHNNNNMYNVIYDDFKLNKNNYYEFYTLDSLKNNKETYVFKYIIFTGNTTISYNKNINKEEEFYDSILIVKKNKLKKIYIKNFDQIYFKSYYDIK